MTSLNPPCWIVSSSGANEENKEKHPVGKYIENVRRTHWYSTRYTIKVKLINTGCSEYACYIKGHPEIEPVRLKGTFYFTLLCVKFVLVIFFNCKANVSFVTTYPINSQPSEEFGLTNGFYQDCSFKIG